MKKLGLGLAIALLTCTTAFADGKVPAKKAVKKATCTSCTKAKCDSKSTCSKETSACVCK